MLKKIVVAMLALGTMAEAGTALAGAKSQYDVYVNDGSFAGTLGTVRNSASGSTWLRCEINSTSGGQSLLCDAYDGSKYRSCTSSTPQLLTAVQSIGGDDYIYVAYSGSTCNYIYVAKASFNEPKKP